MRPGVSNMIPHTKRQSMKWCSPHSPRQKIYISKVRNKLMLVTFFDTEGIIHKEFVPPGQRVNKKYYMEVFLIWLKEFIM
jgi:hypothetical protein